MAAPRKDDVKALILSTAENLSQVKKYSDISLAEIATAAGISKGTLYYHFKSKPEILFAIMDEYLDEQRNDLIKWTENYDKDTSLHRLIKYVLERDISTASMRLHFIYDAISGNEEIRNKLLQRYIEFSNLIASKIHDRDQSVDSNYLSWLLLLISDGLFVHQSLGNPNIDTQVFITHTVNYFKNLTETK